MAYPGNNTYSYYDYVATGGQEMAEGLGLGVGQWSDPYASANRELVAPAPPHSPQADGYTQPSGTDPHWQTFQLDPANFPSHYSSLAGALTLNAPTAASASRNLSPDRQDGLSPSEIYLLRFRPGLAGTEQSLTGLSQPHELDFTPKTEHANVEGGPSALVSNQQESGPSGGLVFVFETPASGEQKRPLVPNRTKRSIPVREPRLETELQPMLIAWAETRTNGKKHVTLSEALSMAIETIEPLRPATYAEYETKMGAPPTTQAAIVEHELFKNLSLRYPPGGNRWTRSYLLEHLLEDLASYFPHPALELRHGR